MASEAFNSLLSGLFPEWHVEGLGFWLLQASCVLGFNQRPLEMAVVWLF
jgi:hypothetical protein